MRRIRLGTRTFFLIMIDSLLAILRFRRKTYESIKQPGTDHHELISPIFQADSSPWSQSTTLKGAGQSPFCVENDYFLLFLIPGGNQTLKEAAVPEGMVQLADEAREERVWR